MGKARCCNRPDKQSQSDRCNLQSRLPISELSIAKPGAGGFKIINAPHQASFAEVEPAQPDPFPYSPLHPFPSLVDHQQTGHIATWPSLGF